MVWLCRSQPLAEPLHPLGGRDARLVAEIAPGGRDVEPVRRGQLAGQEPRHRRLAAEAE